MLGPIDIRQARGCLAEDCVPSLGPQGLFHDSRYGGAGVERVEYPGLDLSHLYVRWGRTPLPAYGAACLPQQI